jgi:hypothetical protein
MSHYLNQFVNVHEGFCGGLARSILKSWSLAPIRREVHLRLTQYKHYCCNYKEGLHHATHSETEEDSSVILFHGNGNGMPQFGQRHFRKCPLFSRTCYELSFPGRVNYWWSSPAQSNSIPRPVELITVFNCLWAHLIFPIYLILLAALSPGGYSASNRIQYQKQINNVSGE